MTPSLPMGHGFVADVEVAHSWIVKFVNGESLHFLRCHSLQKYGMSHG